MLKAVIFLRLFVFLLCSNSGDVKTNRDEAETSLKILKFYTYSYTDPAVGIEVFRILLPEKLESRKNILLNL